jgi:hypothetical protein
MVRKGMNAIFFGEISRKIEKWEGNIKLNLRAIGSLFV